jgi:hypothetical protein
MYDDESTEFLLFHYADLEAMIKYCLATGTTLGSLSEDFDDLVKVLTERGVFPSEEERDEEFFVDDLILNKG